MRRAPALAALFLGVVAAVAAPRAETPVGRNVDSRVILALRADPQAVERFLPEGRAPVPFPAGPAAGANLLLVLIDRAVQLDPAGAPASPAASRHAALVALGGGAEAPPVLYVLRLYSSDPAPDPYGNSVAAAVSRSLAVETGEDGARRHSDRWRVAPADGGALTVTLDFAGGSRSWAPGEANPHSSVRPEFSRIYRYSQLVDIVASEALDRPLDGTVELTSSVPELAGILDGSEEIAAILDVPVYVREVTLP